MKKKDFVWITILTICILLVPLVAMQFSDDVVWNLFDFIVAGILIFGAGSIFVLATRKFPKHKIIIGLAIALMFLYIWAELAVGIFTNLGS